MESNRKDGMSRRALLGTIATLGGIGLAGIVAGCGGWGAHDVRPPEAREFGLGPRASSHGLYAASLDPHGPLKLREMQAVSVRVVDARGRPVEGATITIHGGMPEHGHGLPTQPRVTQAHGDGVYEIEGLRFSMGGWWELGLVIASAAGTDNVTFNLGL